MDTKPYQSYAVYIYTFQWFYSRVSAYIIFFALFFGYLSFQHHFSNNQIKWYTRQLFTILFIKLDSIRFHSIHLKMAFQKWTKKLCLFGCFRFVCFVLKNQANFLLANVIVRLLYFHTCTLACIYAWMLCVCMVCTIWWWKSDWVNFCGDYTICIRTYLSFQSVHVLKLIGMNRMEMHKTCRHKKNKWTLKFLGKKYHTLDMYHHG